MKQITINNFGGGMANDIYNGGSGECSTSRQFDLLTYPNKLTPLASMEADTASTAIGAFFVGTDGVPYGYGTDGGSNVMVYKNSGGNAWTAITSPSIGNAGTNDYNFFIEYKRVGANSGAPDNSAGAKFIVFGVDEATYSINCGDPNTKTANKIADLTHVAGSFVPFVHPKDQILYVAYKTTTGTYVGTYNGTTWSATAFSLPPQYTITSMSSYGDYLAVACSISTPTYYNSIVYLWDRDTSNTLPNESILWGDGHLQVLNNLDGVLIGVSRYVSDDNCALVIKGFSGGSVQTIKELNVAKQTTTSPTITIYPRVNFLHRGRLFFSADLVGGGTSPSHKGLWSVGKNKNGQWSVTVERFVSTNGTDVSVLAAAFKLDYLYACHTSAGTLTYNASLSSALATRFASTSYWESVVNPEMPDDDKVKKKKLMSVAVHTLPLTTSGQVIVKYRVDSIGDWITVFTKTSTSPDTDLVFYESTKPASGQFTDGYNYEFRIESTGGAQIVGLTYKYNTI